MRLTAIAMPTPSTTLVQKLQAHRLLSDEQQRAVADLAVTMPDASKLTAELVSRGWLTRYQVEELSKGRGRDLVVGPYVLLEPLGRGGMGQVFRARDSVLERVVALKLILPERLGSEQAVQRFQREAKAAARLSHPNIVTIYAAGQVGETFYMAMELLAGCNLAEYLQQRGKLPIHEACDYVRQAAKGLQHAHEKGLVHRDIKPGNLLRTDTGQIKVLDLGLALVLEATSLTKKTGAMMGTIDYMAPEQVTDVHKVDIRADVYSLGCTLYHLLTGEVPFDNVHPAARLQIRLQQNPQLIEQLRPDIPAGLAAVVRRMLARQPKDRYSTPGEVAEGLQPFSGVVSRLNSTMVPPTGSATVGPGARAAQADGKKVDEVSYVPSVWREPTSPVSLRTGLIALVVVVAVFLLVAVLGHLGR
jgi:serine/threonine-protein kinase